MISDANVPVRFRAQQRANYSLLLLKANCIAAQTDLRITEHRGHKFSPSLSLFPFKTRIEWPPDWPQSQVFWAYFFNSSNIQGNIQTDLNYPAISLVFVDFAVQFCFQCKFSFHEKRRSSQVWQWRDFPGQTNQSHSFAMHSNQWDCFILYRS